eukprot:3879578-Pyramimonas_sp.AAC.1
MSSGCGASFNASVQRRCTLSVLSVAARCRASIGRSPHPSARSGSLSRTPLAPFGPCRTGH